MAYELSLGGIRFPNEMLIGIFLDVDETDILRCRLVCKKWSEIARDRYLIYYFRCKDIPLTQSLLESCEKNNVLSFSIGVNVYCAFDVNSPKKFSRAGDTHDLWVKCMVAAAKGGSMDVLRKVLSYGPTTVFDEAIILARRYGHDKCASLILEEKQCIVNPGSYQNEIFTNLQTKLRDYA